MAADHATGSPLDVRDSTTILSKPEASLAARQFVRRSLGGRVTGALLDDACLLVSELVMNSVQHANAPGGASVRVSTTAVNGVVRLAVEDDGEWRVRERDEPTPLNGRHGLLLVGQIADRWGVDHDYGTHVWFEIDTHRYV